LDYDRIRRVLENLNRSGAFEVARRLHNEQQVRVARAGQAAEAERLERIYNYVSRSIDPQSLRSANNIAIQALNSSLSLGRLL
jgi:hypothetical protein